MAKHFNPNRTVAAGSDSSLAQEARAAHVASGHEVSALEWNPTISQYTFEIDAEVRPEHSLATALRNVKTEVSPAVKLNLRIGVVESEIARKHEELGRIAAEFPINLSTLHQQIESIARSQGRLQGLLEAQRLYAH